MYNGLSEVNCIKPEGIIHYIQRVNIEIILFQVHEMEIARNQAERKLREHKGNVVEALIALTN